MGACAKDSTSNGPPISYCIRAANPLKKTLHKPFLKKVNKKAEYKSLSAAVIIDIPFPCE
jgi:hypothetical protein